MKRSKNFKAVTRAVAVTAAVVMAAGGVTFAALQSQQDTLTSNTIKTLTANMQLSVDGVNFSNSMPGYDFNNLIPGGAAMPVTGAPVYLKNSGAAGLTVKMAVSSLPTNPDNIDLSKVNVLVTTVGGGTGVQSFTLAALMAANSSGGISIGSLTAGLSQQYKLQVSLPSDAVVNSGATLTNIDFAFASHIYSLAL